MGISGIGNSTPCLRTERSILEQSMGETTGTHRPVDFDASSSHSQTRTNPTQYVSTLQIENIASQIVDEDVEKNKSIWQKGWDFVTSIFSTPKVSSVSANIGSHITNQAKNIHNKIKNNLRKQGIDINELDSNEQKQYFKILLNHSFGKISNSEFLNQLKFFQKQRAQEEARTFLPSMFQDVVNLIKSKFGDFFATTGKLNVAAVDTALQYSSEDIASQLKILYSETAAENRKEVLAAALQELPEGFSQEDILEFCIASERMSEEELNFAKTLIESSNLPEEEKARRLAEILQKQKDLRNESIALIAHYRYGMTSRAYRANKRHITHNETALADIQKQENEIKNQQKRIKEEHEKLSAKYQQEKSQFEIAKQQKENTENSGEKPSFETIQNFNTADNSFSTLKDDLETQESEFAQNENELKNLERRQNLALQAISNHINFQLAYGALSIPQLES